MNQQYVVPDEEQLENLGAGCFVQITDNNNCFWVEIDGEEGETLTGYDIDWLRRVHREGRRMQPLIDRHPEYSSIISRSIDLYLEIINTGLANEKRQSGSNDPSRSPRPPGSSDSES